VQPEHQQPEHPKEPGVPLDEEVVTEIYREHGDALRRFVLRASDDPSSAEDVVQETVLRVWRTAPRITGSLRSYLFRTARNVMIDNYRRAASRPRRDGSQEGLENVPDTAERIDELLSRVLMEEALLRLSREHRDVVLALHYNGDSVAQAAERLGIPAGTVKSRAFYALRALRSVLDELGVER
jgi:RNA polymerase sigma-70 factor, ECF subfamily